MFKVGERVFDINYRWGIVSEVDYSTYPYEVNFDNGKKGVYDKEACLEGSDTRTLYHHDYTPVDSLKPTLDSGNNVESNVLSKREKFAGMAMQGILSADPENIFGQKYVSSEMIANYSVECAYALIKALNESKTS
jgi:hypothetical protein